MAHSFISIKKFTEEPYSKILGYPNATNRQIKSRINEFHSTPIIVNAVNEILVDQYLKKNIGFNTFYPFILSVLNDRNYKKYAISIPKNIHQIHLIDEWSRLTICKKLMIKHNA